MPTTYERKAVFDGVSALFHRGVLTDSQKAGIAAILAEGERRQIDPRCLAYVLATPYWETAQKMQPILEYGGAPYFTRMYDIKGARPAVARELGNTQPGDGARFHGRGLAQTTGRRNYAWASTVLGVDCVANPEELLKTEGAVKLLFVAMVGGHYTGKKLADYFSATKTDWIGARRIINGTDHAAEIAKAAQVFFAALTKAKVTSAAAPTVAPAASKPVPTPVAASTPSAPKPSGLAAFRTAFARLFGRH